MITFGEYEKVLCLFNHKWQEAKIPAGLYSNMAIVIPKKNYSKEWWLELRLWNPGGFFSFGSINKILSCALPFAPQVRCGNCGAMVMTQLAHPIVLFRQVLKRVGCKYYHPKIIKGSKEEIAEFSQWADLIKMPTNPDSCRHCTLPVNETTRRINHLNNEIASLVNERDSLVESLKKNALRPISKNTLTYFQINAATSELTKHHELTSQK